MQELQVSRGNRCMEAEDLKGQGPCWNVEPYDMKKKKRKGK